MNSGYLDSGVTVIMDNSLARHVYKVSEIPDQLFSIKLLFKNKFSISILGLYAGASSAVYFSQADKINFLITKAVKESSFIILDGNFNKNGSCRCVNYKKCLDLGLINSLVNCSVADVVNYFDTDHKAVNVSMGLGGLLNQANKDHWKFDVKNANVVKWYEFKDATAANATMFSNEFARAIVFSDLDAM
ncbi:hypothetical protein G9A89_004737 [Geosiphon pyriformis]|nr:hypothetical protein G9A89_004737 [Geosiphon pyriformis]